MKRLFSVFLLVLCLSANSQEVEAANNAIKMGYNFVTVSQNVVFNSTMQAGGTLTFSAQAMDGGGRAPGDPFTMKLVFYNSSNQIVNTVQQSFTLTYGSATPAPYSINTTNCGSSCATVAYVNVQFYGKDGGYWAGNYGPYIINPSLSFNGSGNILYNPEFGVYGTNGYAQGWTSSNGWQSCALYSGAQTCVVNNGALVNSGNYSATGGTTSSTPGGYTAAPAAPTPVYSSNITATQQSQKTSAQTTHPSGHAVNANIQGSDNEINIQQVSGAGHFVHVGVTGNVNSIDILQTSTDTVSKHYMGATVVGNNNNLILKQESSSKTQFVSVDGSYNSVSTNQKGTGNHYLDLKVIGNNHTAGIVQDGAGSHKATVELSGTQPWNFNLNQNSSTSQTYSLPHNMSNGTTTSGACYTVGGCSLIINQQ